MKRKWHHPEKVETTHDCWRSLGELEGSAGFTEWMEREFPQGAAELNSLADGEKNSRRDFVKLMGASAALAGFGVACSRPVRHLVPFNQHVEWSIPGKALYYSSIRPRMNGWGGDPLVITTYDHRPTRVDGNKLHPSRSGGTDHFIQASILDLYDPNRSRGYLNKGKDTTRDDFERTFLAPFIEAKKGQNLAFLVERSSSPTRNRLVSEMMTAYAGAEFYGHNPLDGGGVEAIRELHGKGVIPVADLTLAKRVLSIDCDFLGNEPVGEDSAWEFSKARKVDDGAVAEMNRLYVVEPAFSLTGGMADHRYRLAGSQVLAFLTLLAREIGGSVGNLGSDLGVVPELYNATWIKECAADLVEAKGRSVILLGERHSKACHAIVAAINSALGAFGTVIKGVKHDMPDLKPVTELARVIESGGVETLIIIGEGDFVFDAPADLKAGELLAKVPVSVHLGARVNLTARAATWHVPGVHYLEAWGDCFTRGGYYSVQQPMISPLWGGVSELELYLKLLEQGEKRNSPLDSVKETAQKLGISQWSDVLRVGFEKNPLLPAADLSAGVGKAAATLNGIALTDLPHPEAVEVILTTGNNYDGRFANNSWLQEVPDPISKLTWDNAALISFQTAEVMGLKDGDIVELSKGDGPMVRVPVLRSPGHADYVLTVPVGYYGPVKLGRTCDGVGFNLYPLKTTIEPYVVTGVKLEKTGVKHDLALTAEHYSMEGRAIAREGTVGMLLKDPDFAGKQGMDAHIPENISLYKGPDYTGRTLDSEERNRGNQVALRGHDFQIDPNHQWAMSIDLNACTGCNSCVVACQAENNIPVVGKSQVLMGREMHWIRMDRYFTSPKDYETISDRGIHPFKGYKETPGKRKVDDDNIEMLPQPVACQQCESAPCETVCPVNATVHSGDGLNAMSYNRCIGTRYCANNCPYKARRFNFYDYNKRPIEDFTLLVTAPGLEFGPLAPATGLGTTSLQLQKNPNVTVRMRGVIEKCTYCVQRLSAAKIAAKVAARDSNDIQVKANSVTVACEDACPTQAIVFGNLKAKGDRVLTAKSNSRNYDLLKYIGTLPRTSYLARIKNPNMKMPGAESVGTVTSKMH